MTERDTGLDRVEEIRVADARCRNPERNTSEGHRRELLDVVDGLTGTAHLPIEHDLAEVLSVKVAQALSVDALRGDVLSVLDRVAARMRADAAIIEQRKAEDPPLDLTLYVLSQEDTFDLHDPIVPPAGHGTLLLCAPSETIQAVTDWEPHLVRIVFPVGES